MGVGRSSIGDSKDQRTRPTDEDVRVNQQRVQGEEVDEHEQGIDHGEVSHLDCRLDVEQVECQHLDVDIRSSPHEDQYEEYQVTDAATQTSPVRWNNPRYDPAIDESRSQILAFLTAYLKASPQIVKKMEFAQGTLKNLKILIEKDEIFCPMCHKYLKENALNPGSHTLDDSLLSINQMLNMTSLITDRSLLIRLAKITGNAMYRVTQEMMTDPHRPSESTLTALAGLQQPVEDVEVRRRRAWREYQATLGQSRWPNLTTVPGLSSHSTRRLDGQASQALDILNAINRPPYVFEG